MLRVCIMLGVLAISACGEKPTETQQKSNEATGNRPIKQPGVTIKAQPIQPKPKQTPSKASISKKPTQTRVAPYQETAIVATDEYIGFDPFDEYDQELIDNLEQLKNALDPDQRIKAAENIDDVDEPRVLQHMQSALQDPEPDVRIAVLKQIADVELYSAVNSVVGALDDPAPEVVLAAIDAISDIGDESLVVKLEPLLDHPDLRVQKSAQQAIADIQ